MIKSFRSILILSIAFFTSIYESNIYCQSEWQLLNSPTNVGLYCASFINDSTGWIVGAYGTVLKTTDGGINWELGTTGFSDWLLSVSFCDELNGWAVGEGGMKFKTTNSGLSWERAIHDTAWRVHNTKVQCFSPSIIYILRYWFTGDFLQDPIMWKTINGGISWTAITPPPPSSYSITDMFFVTEYEGWACGTGGSPNGYQIHHTTNGGVSWFPYYFNYPTLSSLRKIYFKNQDEGWTTDLVDLYHTTNRGTNWNIISSPYFIDLSDFVIFDSVGYASGPLLRIKKTTDYGVNWVRDLTITYWIFDLEFIDENTAYAVGWNGAIYKKEFIVPVELTSFAASILQNDKTIQLNWSTATETNNSGFEIQKQVGSMRSAVGNWKAIGFVPGFGTTTEPKSYSFIDENVTKGTYKYRLKQIDFDGSFEYSNEIEVEVDFTPKEFVLYQNYPNPFNPSTVISYQLPVAGNVTLKVYDILGNEVATLVNEEKQPGIYEVEFGNVVTSRDLSLLSGVYFYQLNAASFTMTKKMILVR